MQSTVLATKENSFEEENCVHCFNHSRQLLAKTLLTPFNAALGSTASIEEDTEDADKGRTFVTVEEDEDGNNEPEEINAEDDGINELDEVGKDECEKLLEDTSIVRETISKVSLPMRFMIFY
jgi:hypothetical protein